MEYGIYWRKKSIKHFFIIINFDYYSSFFLCLFQFFWCVVLFFNYLRFNLLVRFTVCCPIIKLIALYFIVYLFFSTSYNYILLDIFLLLFLYFIQNENEMGCLCVYSVFHISMSLTLIGSHDWAYIPAPVVTILFFIHSNITHFIKRNKYKTVHKLAIMSSINSIFM